MGWGLARGRQVSAPGAVRDEWVGGGVGFLPNVAGATLGVVVVVAVLSPPTHGPELVEWDLINCCALPLGGW